MSNIKKHRTILTVLLVILVVVIIGLFVVSKGRRNYSLADFGVAPLVKTDCSSIKNTNASYSVTTSFNVPDVVGMRDKVKALITKYGGQITNDSFNSYPGSTPTTSSSNANITVTFSKAQEEFLTELSATIKSSGGVSSNYNYTNDNGYSPYTSCIDSMQSVSADVLQLEVLTKALREERNSAQVLLLSQTISNVKDTLRSDVASMNNFFNASDKPSVSISLDTLQK